RALPIAADLIVPKGQVLALLKPLFEVESAEARRSGQVDDPGLLVMALRRVLDAGKAAGLVPLGTVKLALQPRHGVSEFFISFVPTVSPMARRYHHHCQICWAARPRLNFAFGGGVLP